MTSTPRYRSVNVAQPELAESQIRFRMGLVRQRTRTYPLDSMGYNWSGPAVSKDERGNVPTGYIPDDMPRGLPELQVGEADADGFLRLSDQPLPDWTFFDEGPDAKCAVPGAAAQVPVKFADGQVLSLRFVPQCFFTSCLALYETPIVFG